MLSVTGGVPRYLKEIIPGASASTNLERLAFRPNSILRIDFDEMFSDVITKLPTPREKSARTALVYDGNLAPLIETDGYFDALIPFRQLLGL